jgi:hypothetical protein
MRDNSNNDYSNGWMVGPHIFIKPVHCTFPVTLSVNKVSISCREQYLCSIRTIFNVSLVNLCVACVVGGIRGHKRTGSLKYRLPKNYTFWVPPTERMVPPILMCLSNSFTYCTSAKYTTLTFHIFGSLNAMKTKIPRLITLIQCHNMSSFIAIVLVDVNVIAIYELWKSSEFVYYQITQLSEHKYRLAITFAEHNFGPFGRIFFVIVLFQSL